MKDDRCGARTRSGGTCRRWPLAGATRCRLHGGESPNSKAAAKRRLAEADSRAALAYEGITPIDDPVIELGKLANEITGMKSALAQRVAALDSPVFTDAFGSEQIHAEIRLYNEALDRCIKILDLLGKHDLDARLVRVQEDNGRLFQYIVQGILSGLSLTPDQAAQVPDLMSSWLRKASAGVSSRELPAS